MEIGYYVAIKITERSNALMLNTGFHYFFDIVRMALSELLFSDVITEFVLSIFYLRPLVLTLESGPCFRSLWHFSERSPIPWKESGSTNQPVDCDAGTSGGDYYSDLITDICYYGMASRSESEHCGD